MTPTEPIPGFSLIMSALAMVATIILYPITLIVALVSVFRRKTSIAAGGLGILTGGLWVLGLETLKSNLISQYTTTLGSGGPAFANAISSAITAGFGSYVAILGGIILISASYVGRQAPKPAATP